MPQSKGTTSPRQLTPASETLGTLATEPEDDNSSSSTEIGDTDEEYMMLLGRIRQQNEEIRQLQMENKNLAEELEQERTQGAQQLVELEAAAKLAERQIQELSAELVRSRETGKRLQHACESRAIRMHEQGLRDPFEERRRLDMRLQQLELEDDRLRSEVRCSGEEQTKQRDVIGKAEADRDTAQKLYEASEQERLELKQRIGELSRRTREQESQLSLTAKDWLKKSHQLGLLREDMRWKKIESRVTHKLDMGSKATYELPKAAYLPRRLAQSMGDTTKEGDSGAGAGGRSRAGANRPQQQPPQPPPLQPTQASRRTAGVAKTR